MTFLLQIPRRSYCCFHGKEVFCDGMEYYSFIQHEKGSQYLRQDYCHSCWQELQLAETTYWKGRVQIKKMETLKSSEEKAMHYLEEIITEESKKEECFILALYLVRKKVLAFRKSIDNFDLYEKLATEEIISIPKVPIMNLNVNDLQKTLAEKING